MNASILLLPGDGIGPEVTAAAQRVLAHVRPDLDFVERRIGLGALDATGRPHPDDLVDTARASAAVLLGAVGGAQDPDVPWDVRPEAPLFMLRKELDLYANIRPVRLIPSLADRAVLRPDLAAGIDLVIVRELVGGAYFGAKGDRSDGTAFDTFEYTAPMIERVVRRAFALAAHRRGTVTSVDKANILRTSMLWRTVATRVAAEYPDIGCEHLLVDNAAMQLVQRPASFDVLVTENLFGDILSDEAAAMVGGLGMLPSASLGDDGPGLYEPVHGSAPDIAGTGAANPCAAILSAAMLARFSLGDESCATRIESAVDAALDDGVRTRDLGGEATCADVVAAVLSNL